MNSFPSHLIETNKKDEKWVADYIKAAWKDYNDTYPNGFYNDRDKHHEISLYMKGAQPVKKYKKIADPVSTASGEESSLNIDWNVIPIIPKFRRIALGILKKTTYNIVADAVDSQAQDDKDMYYAEAAAKLLLKRQFEQQGIDPQMLGIEETDPSDFDELEIQMEYGYKHQMAQEMEQAIDLILNLNKFPSVREKVIEDLHDFDIAGYKEFFDSSGKIKIRRVKPSNIVTSYSTQKDFSDVHYCGEVIEMTIADLKEMAGNRISKEQYKEIVEKSLGKERHRNSISNENLKNYDGQRVKVLDLEFYSVNNIILEERINKRGNKVIGRVDKPKSNTDKRKYRKTDYKVVYKGKWVIDTNVFFECGLQTNMKRAKKDMTETTMSYHLFSPNLYQMSGNSLGSQMIPIADQIQLAWYKLQNVMLRARPRGIMIEVGALENVPLAKSGKAMTPLDVIDLYNQTGNLVYRAINDEGEQSGYKPIEELNNGIGSEAAAYFDIISRNIQMLRDILGFNEISDGSTPDPRTLKGVASLAQESTNNALSYIMDAERSLTERLVSNISLRIQDSVDKGTISGYVKAIGSESIKFFKASKNISLHEYGIFLRDRPDDVEKEELKRMLELAIQSGQITIADSLYIKDIDNYKQQQKVLAYRIKNNQKEQEERSARDQERNAQVQMQSNQASEQEKRQTKQMEIEADIMKLEREKELEAVLMDKKYGYELQMKQMEVGGRIDQKRIEKDSDEFIADMKTQAQLNKDMKSAPENEQIQEDI